MLPAQAERGLVHEPAGFDPTRECEYPVRHPALTLGARIVQTIPTATAKQKTDPWTGRNTITPPDVYTFHGHHGRRPLQ